MSNFILAEHIKNAYSLKIPKKNQDNNVSKQQNVVEKSQESEEDTGNDSDVLISLFSDSDDEFASTLTNETLSENVNDTNDDMNGDSYQEFPFDEEDYLCDSVPISVATTTESNQVVSFFNEYINSQTGDKVPPSDVLPVSVDIDCKLSEDFIPALEVVEVTKAVDVREAVEVNDVCEIIEELSTHDQTHTHIDKHRDEDRDILDSLHLDREILDLSHRERTALDTSGIDGMTSDLSRIEGVVDVDIHQQQHKSDDRKRKRRDEEDEFDLNSRKRKRKEDEEEEEEEEVDVEVDNNAKNSMVSDDSLNKKKKKKKKSQNNKLDHDSNTDMNNSKNSNNNDNNNINNNSDNSSTNSDNNPKKDSSFSRTSFQFVMIDVERDQHGLTEAARKQLDTSLYTFHSEFFAAVPDALFLQRYSVGGVVGYDEIARKQADEMHEHWAHCIDNTREDTKGLAVPVDGLDQTPYSDLYGTHTQTLWYSHKNK